MKADAKVIFKKNKPEKFTHFELLRAEVDELKDALDEIVKILNYNDINRVKKIEAEPFDLEEVFYQLEE